MAAQESCPRCKEGVLYVVRDTEDATGVRCFHCDYAESRVRPGFEVVAPGEPITKVPKKTKATEEVA